MRIKRLEIHNIASIENAVIDFDRQPLSNAELFLITGTTGAGKTTILDAICLALYNTTPRIAKGSSRDFQVNKDGLTGVDPRNVMRQNTGEAYSKVFFTGNDGNDYCAEWSVQRGKRKKPASELSNVVWTLANITEDKQVSGDSSRKYSDVENFVVAAVGLDFHQFCRTTMLAQGEFTEFLKSDEDSKAAILEKISGSGIYRKIGAEIFNQCALAKKKVDEQEEKHARITVLNQEERQAKEGELHSIEKELSELGGRVERLQKEILWIENEALARKRCEDAKLGQERIAKELESEEFILRKKQVGEWNETIEARGYLKNFFMYKDAAENAETGLHELERVFKEAVAGELYFKETFDATLEEQECIKGILERQAPNATIYSQVQTIVADIRAYKAVMKSLEEKRGQLVREQEVNFPQAEAKLSEAIQMLEKAKNALDVNKTELDRINGVIAELNLQGKRKEKEFLQEIVSIKQTIGSYTVEIMSAEKSIKEKEEELEKLRGNCAKEKEEQERLEIEHKRRSQTIEKFAKQMRALLHGGLGREENYCPVCGQHVAALPSDAVIDEEYRKIDEEYNGQLKKYKDAETAVIKMESLISVEKRALAAKQMALEKQTGALAEKMKGREDAEILRYMPQEEMLEKLAILEKEISEGEEFENKARKISTGYTLLLTEKGKAETQYIYARNGVETLKGNIVRLQSEIQGETGDANALKSKMEVSLRDSLPWKYNWEENPDSFMEELGYRSAQYEADMKILVAIEATISTSRPQLQSIKGLREGILEHMQHWSAEDVIAAEVNDLQQLWITLAGNVQTQKQAFETAADACRRNAEKVNDFLASHPMYSMERLNELNGTDIQEHNAETEFVRGKQIEFETAVQQYITAQRELSGHLTSKPQGIREEASLEILDEEKKACDGRRDLLNIRKGVLDKEIKDDDEAIKLKGDTTLLDTLKGEYEKWRSFSKDFGDSEGRKLSRIAQSYVLGTLLSSANRYLRNMAPRYSLLVNPGTLNLKLEDKYNGYSTRSTNSISGGESFLVSLALALALADFGQHLGVSMLFIDEGFGTLSGEALQSAINTLKTLHSDVGRQVGIISHREEIRESIPVQIKVNMAPGTSTSSIEVLG